jgi:hypothetical protein
MTVLRTVLFRKVVMLRCGVAALQTHYDDADWNDWLP